MAKRSERGKISKDDAGYTFGMPHCGICEHYSEDEANEKEGADDYNEGWCELVAGAIDEDMYCRLYKPGKEAEKTLAGSMTAQKGRRK